MTATPVTPLALFYSYAHKDEKLRIELNKHLANLQHQGYIAPWHDRNISAGQEWEHEIDQHLNSAHIILLLISKDFMASTYCYSIEMQRALERHNAKEAVVIPIILSDVDWKDAPFSTLQVLPTDGKPMTSRRHWKNRDEAFTNVAQGIRTAITSHFPDFKPVPPLADIASAAQQRQRALTPAWNIPYRRNPFFTGREEVFTRLRDNLTQSHAAALTQAQAISGLGGIGKTQIAVEYAYRHRQEYPYVLWVRAATRDTLIGDFVTLAGLLQLPEAHEQDQNIAVEAVKHWLDTHDTWLLILDNADDLELAAEFLPLDSKGHILLTTRAQAAGAINGIEVEKMDRQEGMLLLLRRAKVLAVGAPLEQAPERDRAQAEAIVLAMDGLPLALDQAGAYIEETGCSVADYLERYQQREATLLQRRGQAGSAHPEPVATTWSLSFEQVEQQNPVAAELLRCCAFLAPDAIPEELIVAGATELDPLLQTLATDPLLLDESLGTLRRFSFIRRNSDDHSISVHRLVQAVLKESIPEQARQRWAERAVRAVNKVFPIVTMETWPECQRYLPQAQTCAELISTYTVMLPEAPRLLNQAAFYLKEHAFYKQAEPLYQQALAIREQVLGAIHPDTAQSLNNLAALYYSQGKYEQAKPFYQRALAIYEQVLGPTHPDTAGSFNNLAGLYYTQGQYEQAEPLYQRALDIREQVLGADHPNTATSLNNLAALYYSQGKYEQAEPLLQRALAIYEQVLGADHPNTVRVRENYAGLVREMKQKGKGQ